MSEPTATGAHRFGAHPPRGLLGMLVLVVVVETIISGYRVDLAPTWAEDWRFSAWAAERQAPGTDFLCFGDSLIKYGVLPRVIEAKSGLKGYNLATSGGTMPSAYFLFRRSLDAGARPRAVLVDFAALMLRNDGPLLLQNYPELATVGDCVDLAWTAHDPQFLAGALLAKLLPSVNWRFEVRRMIMARLAGGSGSMRYANSAQRIRWEIDRGAQPTQTGRKRHQDEDYLIDGVSPESWAIQPRDEVYLDRFVALARSRTIPVYWVIPPLCPEAHARRARRGADAAYDRLVRAKLARFPNIVVLDARPSGYDDSTHVDHLHLDKVGAAALSGDIAAVLASRLGGDQVAGSWVTLPPYGGCAAITPPPALATERGPTVR